MSAELRKETRCLEEMLPTLPIGGMELVPWIVRDSRNFLGIPVHIYDNIDALTEPGKNFISLWSGGNFPYFCLSPSNNKLGQEIDSRHASRRGCKLIVSSKVIGDRKYLQVLSVDLPLLSQPDGFSQVWDLTSYWGKVRKVVIEHISTEYISQNSPGLAFISVPPLRGEWGNGGVLIAETIFLRDPQAKEALSEFLENREFKIK